MAKKKELWTDKDRQGLAEKKGLNLGSIITEKDKKHMLFTEKDKSEGLL